MITSNMLIDADFGYTRQVTGAQSSVDLALGDYGTNVLGIPGTNGPGKNYVGQPVFAFGTVQSTGTTNSFSSLGNASGANPFLFRDNQFTGDVNFSWTKGRHAMKYGFTYYHFLLNHFQPTSGGAISNPRGGFAFQGGLTCGGASCGISTYNTLADFLLGLPNQGTGQAVAKATQMTNPNALRWSEFGAYAQDQWTVTPRLTLNYGVRYEFYPPPYRDHSGVYILDPILPQTANVEIGGVSGNPQNAGLQMGWGYFAPRVGGAPFTVGTRSNLLNAPGNPFYADLVKPYHQLGGHNRTVGNSTVSSGKPWFDPTSFAVPVEPTYTATQAPDTIASPRVGSSNRDEFRGPGTDLINASVFRGFHVWRESEFQIRFEAFNVLNHPQLMNPNATVTGGTFGYITTFGNTRSLQLSGRFNF